MADDLGPEDVRVVPSEKATCRLVEHLMRGIDEIFQKQGIAIDVFVGDLERRLKTDPRAAVKTLRSTFYHTLEEAHDKEATGIDRSYANAMTGGPHEGVPRAWMNAVGAVYPLLPRDVRGEALAEIVGVLDHYRWNVVQTLYMPGVRDPQLVADIGIVRPLYWPGLDHQNQKLLAEFETFEQFRKTAMNAEGLFNPRVVESDAIVGTTILRSDMCKWGEEFVQATHPELTDRLTRGIVTWRFSPRPRREYSDQSDCFWSDPAKGTARLKELLPRSLHDRIEPLRLQADWPDVTKF